MCPWWDPSNFKGAVGIARRCCTYTFPPCSLIYPQYLYLRPPSSARFGQQIHDLSPNPIDRNLLHQNVDGRYLVALLDSNRGSFSRIGHAGIVEFRVAFFSTALVSSGELAVPNYTVPGLRLCGNQIAPW